MIYKCDDCYVREALENLNQQRHPTKRIRLRFVSGYFPIFSLVQIDSQAYRATSGEEKASPQNSRHCLRGERTRPCLNVWFSVYFRENLRAREILRTGHVTFKLCHDWVESRLHLLQSCEKREAAEGCGNRTKISGHFSKPRQALFSSPTL